MAMRWPAPRRNEECVDVVFSAQLKRAPQRRHARCKKPVPRVPNWLKRAPSCQSPEWMKRNF